MLLRVIGRLVDGLDLGIGWVTTLPGRTMRSATTLSADVRDEWLANPVAQAYRRSRLQRLLTWASKHPGWFTVLVGCLAAAVTKLVLLELGSCLLTTHLCSHAPKLKDDFDLAAYLGVPWGTQATLVALVYPFVVSFMALMLQRRAHSTTALRLYALESAVIPAGASSLGFLAVLALEYFAGPHANEHKDALILPILVFNATWFLANLALTGYFLTRTIQFLQEDEQTLIYKQLAIDVILREELDASITQSLVASAPQKEWGQPGDGGKTAGAQTIFWRAEAVPQVEILLPAGQVIADVRLRMLSWVRTTWLRRALKAPSASSAQRTPTLHFRLVGEHHGAGRIALCSVSNGPNLNRWERWLVEHAYSIRQQRDTALGLSTERMLTELSLECQTHYDEGRYEVATEVVLEQVDLHKALLNACVFAADGTPDNAALMSSAVRWAGDQSFQWKWLATYRDISKRAVKLLEEDDRLFRRMAYVSASIVRSVPLRPVKVLDEAQFVATHLAHELAQWWMQRAQVAKNTAPGFDGVLAEPLNQLYDSAVVFFIGAWDSIDVELPQIAQRSEDEHWQDVAARAQVYATHIDNSAKLFLDAMARADAVAAERFCDHFLNWWGIHEYDLPFGHLDYDPDFAGIDFGVISADWSEVVSSLPPGNRYPVTHELGTNVANLALRRYWESMRLLLVLLCLKNAGGSPASGSREIRMAMALLQGKPLRRGADVTADQLSTLDDVLSKASAILLGGQTVLQRLNGFCRRLRWEDETPEVAGWMYSWSGGETDFDSLTPQLVQLLVSLADARRNGTPDTAERLNRFQGDIDKLEELNRFSLGLRRGVLFASFRALLPAVQVLRGALATKDSPRRARLAIAGIAKKMLQNSNELRKAALNALSVSQARVDAYAARVSAAAFDDNAKSSLRTTVEASPTATSVDFSIPFRVARRRLTDDVGAWPEEQQGQKYPGENIRVHADAWALHDYLKRSGVLPVPATGLEKLSSANSADLAAFVVALASACAAMQAGGATPLILVSPGPVSGVLQPYQWLAARGRALPAGITLQSTGNADRLFNGVTVRETDIPGGGCYVVPADDVAVLQVSAVLVPDALKPTWKELDFETIQVTLTWQAQMGP